VVANPVLFANYVRFEEAMCMWRHSVVAKEVMKMVMQP